MNHPAKLASRCISRILRAAIFIYRYSLSYFLGRQCRFTPTCSAFALEAVEIHGPVKGVKLAIQRVCRCHPWGGHGIDPVPEIGRQDPGIRP